MIRRVGVVSCMAYLLLFSGCASNIGMPQTRDEFVAAYKHGGMFRNAEQVISSRPIGVVIADVTEFSNKCLKVRVSTAPSYQHKMSGGVTTYNARVEMSRNSVMALSVQEKYNDKAETGAPPGGIYTLVAEMRSAGGKSQVDIYHASRGKIVDSLKDWIEGNKRSCPSF